MRGVSVEESETGKFSLWVHLKNWVSDYLKASDLNLDGEKDLQVDIKTITEEDPDATTKNNPSLALSYDADGRLQYIDLTIGATTWRKTLAYTSGRLSSISAWVKQ